MTVNKIQARMLQLKLQFDQLSGRKDDAAIEQRQYISLRLASLSEQLEVLVALNK